MWSRHSLDSHTYSQSTTHTASSGGSATALCRADGHHPGRRRPGGRWSALLSLQCENRQEDARLSGRCCSHTASSYNRQAVDQAPGPSPAASPSRAEREAEQRDNVAGLRAGGQAPPAEGGSSTSNPAVLQVSGGFAKNQIARETLGLVGLGSDLQRLLLKTHSYFSQCMVTAHLHGVQGGISVP